MKALIIDGNSLFHRAFHATSTQFNKETKKWESIMPFFEKNNIKPNNATKLCLFWFLSIVKKNSYDYFITC
jgi:5'-3' exonuclease